MSIIEARLPTLTKREDVEEKVEIQTIHTSKILWKLDVNILHLLGQLVVFSIADRTCTPIAGTAGMVSDIKLVGNQLNIGVSICYLLYILCPLPFSLLLKKAGANRYIAFLTVMWGLTTLFMGTVQNFAGLVVLRLLFGFFTSGYLPVMVLYMSYLYKREELQARMGFVIAILCTCVALAGLIFTGILRMDGARDLAGWRWVFILFGITTAVNGIMSYFTFPANVGAFAKFSADEAKFASARLRGEYTIDSDETRSTEKEDGTDDKLSDENDAEMGSTAAISAVTIYSESEPFEWREVMRGLRDPQAWLTGFALMGITICKDSFATIVSSAVAGLGYSGIFLELHSVPVYVPATVLTFVVSIIAAKYKLGGPIALLCLPVAMIGYIIVFATTNAVAQYSAVFLISLGCWTAYPLILTLVAINTAGHYKRAAAVSLQAIFAHVGELVATYIYTDETAPDYARGHGIALTFLVLSWVAVAVNTWNCSKENKARAEGLRQDNILAYQQLWNTNKTRAPIGDRHPEFRYML